MTTNYLETGITIVKDDGSEETYQIPYNINNILIKEEDIINMLNDFNVKVEKINDITLFHRAFTHKSYIKKDIFTNEVLSASKNEINNPESLLELQSQSYERLEYFGDRVVKINVSWYLFNRYPDEDEGFMTRLQTKIEDKKNLSVFSKILGLGKYFIISKQIDSLNGRQLDKIHEDTFEAFLGALYLSNGPIPCKQLLIFLLESKVDWSEKLYCDNNYKDNLLRYHHKQKWRFPLYHMLHFDGPPHKRTYIMGVENPNNTLDDNKKYIEEKNYNKLCISFGKGSSKKEGEQYAAKMSLILHGLLNNDQYELNDIYYPNWNELFNNKETESSDETESDYD